MRVQQQCTRGLIWDDHQPPSLSLGCKRLRPLAPPVSPGDRGGTTLAATFDVKSFIKPECGPRKIVSSCDAKKARSTHQVEAQAGGTRWNPTQEQIGILEMLYKSGMRTPNAHEIEQITTQLGKYGKIEGKNVFYWFQNHKARERQKLKRTLLGLSPLSPRTPSPRSIDTSITLTFETTVEQSPYKKKCQKWRFEDLEENREEGDKTLELFPLHPEAR